MDPRASGCANSPRVRLQPQVLEEAGLKDADILLAVTDRDEVNLVACFFANIISPRVRTVALIRNPDYTEYREALSRSITNITTVINPEREVVRLHPAHYERSGCGRGQRFHGRPPQNARQAPAAG